MEDCDDYFDELGSDDDSHCGKDDTNEPEMVYEPYKRTKKSSKNIFYDLSHNHGLQSDTIEHEMITETVHE
jgi:hypothetical protein